MGTLSDWEIIQEVRLGKHSLYGELVRRYQKRVYALGIKFFRNGEDARDFTQEVFLKAYERLSTFKGESGFYTWLFRVAYYLGVSWNRKRKPSVSLPEDFDIHSMEPGPEALHLQKKAVAALERALEELPERYRICLELYFSFGMTYQDISGITDIPLGTVKSHVFRAKNKLREMLSGTEAEGPYDL